MGQRETVATTVAETRSNTRDECAVSVRIARVRIASKRKDFQRWNKAAIGLIQFARIQATPSRTSNDLTETSKNIPIVSRICNWIEEIKIQFRNQIKRQF